jgi:hypothetical protein
LHFKRTISADFNARGKGVDSPDLFGSLGLQANNRHSPAIPAIDYNPFAHTKQPDIPSDRLSLPIFSLDRSPENKA